MMTPPRRDDDLETAALAGQAREIIARCKNPACPGNWLFSSLARLYHENAAQRAELVLLRRARARADPSLCERICGRIKKIFIYLKSKKRGNVDG